MFHSRTFYYRNMSKYTYTNNQIKNVLLRLSYPTILKIDTEPPVAFQEEVKNSFPEYQVSGQQKNEIVLPGQLNALPVMKVEKSRLHTFSEESADVARAAGISGGNGGQISLSNEELILRFSRYSTWSEFKGHAENIVRAFLKIYQPALFKQISLRYINIFNRKDLDLESHNWSELFTDKIAGYFINCDEDKVGSYNQEIVMQLDDAKEHLARYKHLLGRVRGETETCFILDAEYMTAKPCAPSRGMNELEALHGFAENIIERCASKLLREKLGEVEQHE